MKILQKLLYVACMSFFFAACEENYNDKLFWPEEISQEYGSYIKPYTLDLTYSGEKLSGKTVSFQTNDSETGTLTLNGIIPGEPITPISHITLYENGDKDAYIFSGTNTTMGGVTIKYKGNVTPKAMKLSLDVTMAYTNTLSKTYIFPNRSYTDPTSPSTRQSGASYINIASTDPMGGIIAGILPQIVSPLLDTLLPYALQSITLEKDGNVCANYTTDTFDFQEVTDHQTVTDTEFKTWINGRNYSMSPRGLAYWNRINNNTLIVQLNIPAVISLIAQNSEQEIDSKLISGICEALLNSDPVRFKSILSIINVALNNDVINYIVKIDDDTFSTIFSWLKNGIPLEFSQIDDHTYIYLNKKALTPIMNALLTILGDKLAELELTPEDILGMLTTIETMNIGLDLLQQKVTTK